MLSPRRKSARNTRWSQPMPRPAAPLHADDSVVLPQVPAASSAGLHPLTNASENQRLFEYEQGVKGAFDAIVPTLKHIAALQHEQEFETRAQAIAREQLGFELPEQILADAWVEQLDMRRLFAWCVFETYRAFCDDFFSDNLLGVLEKDFQNFLLACGYHTLDISPCADGRLAHVISYVLRLPYRSVRRKSYAGAMFDIEDSIAKWTETEMLRHREGHPTTAEAPTRYLKTVVYHFSSVDPNHEGCAAHGSVTDRAAQGGLDRLLAFQQAVQGSFCCGASIDLLLIGLDTDTDAIRVHIPDIHGAIRLDRYIDNLKLHQETQDASAHEAEARIAKRVQDGRSQLSPGMAQLIIYLLRNNLSQIDYVRSFHGEHYQDIGHAERFIGAGIGFEEVQLRNLTYFAYLHTVEEATADLDVGIKIFTRLNVAHGLPVPIVVRFDYHGTVPGARERAIAHCQRINTALRSRYTDLVARGLLHTLLVVRDCQANGQIEVLSSSAYEPSTTEAH